MCFRRLMSFWQSLRPHFLCRHSDRKFARSPPKPIASVVMGQCKKQEDKVLRMKSLWRTVRFSTWKDFSVLTDFWLRTAFSGGQFLADFKGKILTFSFTTATTKDWRFENLIGWRQTEKQTQTSWLSDFQTFLICRQKVHLDSEKRNLKLGLLAEVKLTTFVRTENCQTENSIWSEKFTERCWQT